MCGIFALYRPDASAALLRRDLVAMSRRLAHRGRDASGVAMIPRAGAADGAAGPTSVRYWTGAGGPRIDDAPPACEGAAGFVGHHRLAIVDTDERSTQPLVDRVTGVALAMNGEIYNFLELRAELGARGHRFRTRGDGEVALRGYLEWGPGCLQRFVGDFAVVVLDAPRRRLLAARDRLGAKPLFAWQVGATLALSSELKGLLDLRGFAPRLDESVAVRYLAAEFPTEDTLGRSFLQSVEPIPAAAWMQWTLGPDGASVPTTHRYWDLDEAVAAAPAPPTFREGVERIDALLAEAVRIRLRCDVPVGALLSGGLDSPLVAWHAVRHGGPLPTFSAVFPGHDDDEGGAAAEVAACLGVPNEQMTIDDALDVERLAEATYEQDEPFTTLNVVTQSALLRRAAARGVRVLFDGGGADELLGGYDDYRVPAAADRGGPALTGAARRLRDLPGPELRGGTPRTSDRDGACRG